MRTKGVGPHGLGVSPLKQTDYEKALNQKHSVKTKTSSQGDNNSIKRNTVSEVTNIESKSNRRTQKVSGNSKQRQKGLYSYINYSERSKQSGKACCWS